MSPTPTQKRMLNLLQDELPHSREELRACLYDEYGHVRNIRAHLSALRAYLRKVMGKTITCTMVASPTGRKTYYRIGSEVVA